MRSKEMEKNRTDNIGHPTKAGVNIENKLSATYDVSFTSKRWLEKCFK